MLTKTFHSIQDMFERLLNMYKEKSTKGLLALMAAFVCGFIWPLLGLLAAVWTRHQEGTRTQAALQAWQRLSTSLLTSYR